MSAIRSVVTTLAANLVIGFIMSDVRKVLERPHLVLVEGALTPISSIGALGTERVGNAGDGVGRPRAGPSRPRSPGFPVTAA